MIELKRKSFEFKLDGKTYNVRSPKVKEVEKLQKESKEKGDEDLSVAINFLDSLGMPKDVCYGMEAEHLQIVIETVSGASEKK